MNSILNNQTLRDRLIREGLLEAEACTPQENERYQAMLETGDALPDGIFRTNESPYEFLRIVGGMPTPEEERNLMLALQTYDIKTIRGWVTFIGVVILLCLIIAFLSLVP